jgi:hypothetical protein
MIKIAVIKKLPNGKYQVQSHEGKNLGTYKSKEKAEKRLRQIEFFKYLDKHPSKRKKKASTDQKIDLTDVDDMSLSAIMRQLNKQCDPGVATDFLTLFKQCFDRLILDNEDEPSKKALGATLLIFCKKYPVILE